MKLIKNALIYDKKSSEEILADILYDTKIKKIGKIDSAEANDVLDLAGKLLVPGCIDAHVHFNDPGFTHHETFETGSRAAITGGITTIVDMPCTSLPAVTSRENLYKKLEVVAPKAVVDYAFWGGIPGNDFPLDPKKVLDLWHEGVVGFKMYTISGMESYRAVSYEDIKEAFEKVPEVLFAFHAEDAEEIGKAMNKYSTLQQKKPETYVHTRPVAAEDVAVSSILAQNHNNHIHFVHISSKLAAEKILTLWEDGADVSFETCPQYLQFTSEDFPTLRGRLKTAPPVKFKEDRDFLRNAVKSGKVDFITTDHAGSNWETEKDLEDFSKVYNGIPGTQFMVPYLFSEFYQKEKVDLGTMIKLVSENPAKRYGFYPNKGSLNIGTDADFTIIDLKKEMIVDEHKLESIGKYSPFNGMTFECRVAKTIIRGKEVYNSEKGILADPGFGKWIKRR